MGLRLKQLQKHYNERTMLALAVAALVVVLAGELLTIDALAAAALVLATASIVVALDLFYDWFAVVVATGCAFNGWFAPAPISYPGLHLDRLWLLVAVSTVAFVLIQTSVFASSWWPTDPAAKRFSRLVVLAMFGLLSTPFIYGLEASAPALVVGELILMLLYVLLQAVEEPHNQSVPSA